MKIEALGPTWNDGMPRGGRRTHGLYGGLAGMTLTLITVPPSSLESGPSPLPGSWSPTGSSRGSGVEGHVSRLFSVLFLVAVLLVLLYGGFFRDGSQATAGLGIGPRRLQRPPGQRAGQSGVMDLLEVLQDLGSGVLQEIRLTLRKEKK